MYLKRLQVWSRGKRERLRKGERHAYAFRKKLYWSDWTCMCVKPRETSPGMRGSGGTFGSDRWLPWCSHTRHPLSLLH